MLSAAAAICATSAAVQAADLRDMLAPPDYPPPPLVWTGPYVGANAGYAWSVAGDQLALRGDRPTGLFSTGEFGGVQVGYNFQVSRSVLGVETEFDGANIGSSAHDLLFGDNFSSRLRYFGALRSRIGYTFDRALIYIDGGLAYGGLSSNVNGPVLIGSPYNFSGVAVGYTLGGGVEYALTNNWSIRTEYQFMDLGKNDPTNAAGAHYSAIAGGGWATVKQDAFNLFRVGIIYSFK